MEAVRQGMVVAGPNGRIGVVTDTYDEATGLARIVVQRDDGQTMLLYPGDFTVDGDTVRLDESELFGSPSQSGDAGTMTDYATQRIDTTVNFGSIQAGTVVSGPNGRVGTVTDTFDETSGLARLVVQRDDGQTMLLYPGDFTVDGDTVRLDEGETTGFETRRIDTATTQDLAPAEQVETEVRELRAGEQVVIPVIREEIVVQRREVERGGVRVHKRIQEREETVEQPTYREEVTVEHVPIGRPIESVVGIETREEGDTLIIPVVEEVLVVEKRLVLKEEIRITKRRIDETEQARVVIRSEEVEVEELDELFSERDLGRETVA